MKQTQRDVSELKKHLRKSAALLRTLKDDVRLELHLAGMEAKSRLKRLAPKLAEVERLARQLTASRGVQRKGGRS